MDLCVGEMASDLDVAARRRLWCLLRIVGRYEARAALELAARMALFITSGRAAPIARPAQIASAGAAEYVQRAPHCLPAHQKDPYRKFLYSRKPRPRAGKRRTSSTAQITRDQELAMQEAFLRKRQVGPPTMADVILFLRQRGDVVLTTGGGYVVNGASSVDHTELVRRANRMRERMGLPTFAADASHSQTAEHVLPRT
jgi:hypothetical protein